MFDETAENDANENDQSTAVNRRRFVKSVGVASGVTALSSFGAGSASAHERKGNVMTISQSSENHAIRTTLSDDETEQLSSFMKDKGWVLNPHEATASYMVPSETSSFTFVTMPLEKKQESANSDNLSVFLTWTNHEQKGGSTVTTLDSAAGFQRQYAVESGKITVNTTDIDSISENTTSSVGTLACSYYEERCDNPNWSCLAEIGVMYGSCATAVLAGGVMGVIWCLADAGVGILQVAQNENCSLCDSTSLHHVNLCRF